MSRAKRTRKAAMKRRQAERSARFAALVAAETDLMMSALERAASQVAYNYTVGQLRARSRTEGQ